MEKIYLVENEYFAEEGWRQYIEVPTDEIYEAYPTANTIYVKKDDVLDLSKHKYSHHSSDHELNEEEVEEYYAIIVDDVNYKIRNLIGTYNGDLNKYNQDMYERDRKVEMIFIEEVLRYLKEIVEFYANEVLVPDLYHDWCDGKDWYKMLVKSGGIDPPIYQDMTENLEGMEKLQDGTRGKNGHCEFYRTRKGKIIEMYTSYYKGEGKRIKFHTPESLKILVEESGIELEEH